MIFFDLIASAPLIFIVIGLIYSYIDENYHVDSYEFRAIQRLIDKGIIEWATDNELNNKRGSSKPIEFATYDE